MDITIAVIVPIYNGEKYIERCLNSIQCQTHQFDEIILVDNNSTDESLLLCKKLAVQNQRVTVLEELHQGPGCARNRGLKQAQSTYITFLDCDDYLEPNYVEVMLNNLKDNPTLDMVVCGRYFEYFNGYELKQKSVLNYKDEIIDITDISKDPYVFFKYSGTKGPVCKVFRKKIINIMDKAFPESIKIMEDLCFVMKYISLSKRIKMISLPMYHQIWHNDSLSKSGIYDCTSWETVVDEINSVISKYANVEWGQFYKNTISGIPMMYINTCIRNGKWIPKIYRECKGILQDIAVSNYVRNYCVNTTIHNVSNNNVTLWKYIIVFKFKLILHKCKISLLISSIIKKEGRNFPIGRLNVVGVWKRSN